MQTVAWWDSHPKPTLATSEQARTGRAAPDDDAARAELQTLCATCTSLEIAAVLDRLPTLDGNYRDSRFVGIVAAMRGSWAGLPVRGPLFEYEWYHLWEGGAPNRRAQYGQWLEEELERKPWD